MRNIVAVVRSPENCANTHRPKPFNEYLIRRRLRDGSLRSPMTNEPMGPKLFPSAQTRSMIRTLVRTGAIGGDKGQGGAVRYFP